MWAWNHPWQFFFLCWAIQIVLGIIGRITGLEILVFVPLALWLCWTAIALPKLGLWLYRRFSGANE